MRALSPRVGRRAVRALALAAALAVLGGGLTACSSDADTVAAQAKQGDNKGYVAGDGTIEQIAPAQRTTSISVSGTTLDGEALDTADYRGKVVVLNTWGSWCPPCNAEAPDLQKVWESVRDKGVQFVGVDLREGAAGGLAFQRRYAISYPSLRWDGGAVIVQMKGKATATPTTLVIDRQGRLAGRISGRADASTLTGLVHDILGEAG